MHVYERQTWPEIDLFSWLVAQCQGSCASDCLSASVLGGCPILTVQGHMWMLLLVLEPGVISEERHKGSHIKLNICLIQALIFTEDTRLFLHLISQISARGNHLDLHPELLIPQE